ncbi:glutathione synthetase [secondary endosymbiont of Heteropsylla cubana]|uniref:Glutathione synthetase n=1 Tax=secondary endosymbiont of Heteropsylla cubana TaxID=134287 RepID=J3TZ72_9ENTR|nr:glutathione synthase [secondary endosymbiont of Heteropsylla cubana]AFP85780.1 glutathione synthetase [secondary endosymbiont of Heteropsylla cubana]
MIKLGIVMDPISTINIQKDTSFAMLLEAQNRGYKIYYMEMNSLYLSAGKARASTQVLSVKKEHTPYYTFNNEEDINLEMLDIILMRKNPPFDRDFLYATYILEIAEHQGVLVVNKPQSLRDCNEKLFTMWFPKYTPDTLVSKKDAHLRAFWKKHGDIILKPLNGMGGQSIFHIKSRDPNLTVIIENLTGYGRNFCMAQNYLPSIKDGDKRVFVIDGKTIPYCLARIPKIGETRGNLIAGGQGEVRPLTKNDWKIADALAPTLKKKGLIFVGLDIIGQHLTEINVTSPTCVCEIEAAFPISINGILLDAIEKRIILKKR